LARASLSVRFLVTASAVASSLPAAASSAVSREREDWTRNRPGRFKFGPFYVTPKLELRNAGVDTNVFNQLARPVTDTSVVLRPSLAGAFPFGRRVRLQGSGYLDFNYFRRQATERSTDFGVDGAGEVDVGPFTFFGEGGGLQARQLFTIDLDERIRRQEKFGGGGVDLRLGRTFQVTVRGDERQLRYAPSRVRGAELQRALDRDSLAAALELRSKLSVFSTAVASAEVIEDTFVRQRDEARRIRSYRLLGGFEISPGALLSGTLLVGVRHIPDSSAIGVSRYTGPAIRVATTIPVRSSARLSLSADRDVYYAMWALRTRDARLRNTYVSSRYTSTLDVLLPFGLLGRGTFGFQNARYLLPYRIGELTLRKVDHLYIATGTLLRPLGRSIRIGGTLTWARRVSTIASQSYEGLRYGVTAEVAP
jgi:hypothetical protein